MKFGPLVTAAFLALASSGPLSTPAYGDTQAAKMAPAVKSKVGAAEPADQTLAGGGTGNQAQPSARDLTPVFSSERDEARPEQPGGVASAVRALGALLVVLGLVGAAAWALKRYGRRRAREIDRAAFGVITSTSLADKRTLSVIRFGAHALLIGSTPSSVTLLAQVPLSEIDHLTGPGEAKVAHTEAPAFARQLNQVYAELEANERIARGRGQEGAASKGSAEGGRER